MEKCICTLCCRWNETVQIADTKYVAYGAGPAANKRFVHVELSETSNR